MKGSIASSRGPLAVLQVTDHFPYLEGTDQAALTDEAEMGVFTSKHSWCLASAIGRSPPAGRKGPGGGRRRGRGRGARRKCRVRPLGHCWGTTTVPSLTWGTPGLALCHRSWGGLFLHSLSCQRAEDG